MVPLAHKISKNKMNQKTPNITLHSQKWSREKAWKRSCFKSTFSFPSKMIQTRILLHLDLIEKHVPVRHWKTVQFHERKKSNKNLILKQTTILGKNIWKPLWIYPLIGIRQWVQHRVASMNPVKNATLIISNHGINFDRTHTSTPTRKKSPK